MQERKNPYLGWSITRLLQHKKKIEEAITTTELSVDGQFSAKKFREVHSRPECKIDRERAGQEFGPVNAEGVQFVATYYTLICTTHNVKSG